MKSDSSGDKDIFILMFLGGFLAAFLLVFIIIGLGRKEKEENESKRIPELKELSDRTNKFFVRDHKFEGIKVCLEGKEMMVLFYRNEPQVINLNKDCEKQNDAN